MKNESVSLSALCHLSSVQHIRAVVAGIVADSASLVVCLAGHHRAGGAARVHVRCVWSRPSVKKHRSQAEWLRADQPDSRPGGQPTSCPLFRVVPGQPEAPRPQECRTLRAAYSLYLVSNPRFFAAFSANRQNLYISNPRTLLDCPAVHLIVLAQSLDHSASLARLRPSSADTATHLPPTLLCSAMGSINTVGLLTIGNVGVGKSFLLDAIAGRAVFRTARRVRAVTARTTSHTVVVGDKTYTLFDIPGLIEMGNEQKIESNKAAVSKAFSQCAEQIVLVVMGHLNLRPQAQDLATFLAVRRAYDLHQRSIIFVVNQISTDDGKREKADFTASLKESLNAVGVCPDDLRVVFCIDIGRNVDFAGPAAQAIRRQLLGAATASVAHTHTKKRAIELRHAEMEMLRRRLEQVEEEKKRELDQRRELDEREASVSAHSSASAILPRQHRLDLCPHMLRRVLVNCAAFVLSAS